MGVADSSLSDIFETHAVVVGFVHEIYGGKIFQIAGNHVLDEGATALAEALHGNRTLKFIGLQSKDASICLFGRFGLFESFERLLG